MSKVTSPILLDSTGQETNKILQQISDSLLAANTLIDDNSTASNRVWSSNKIVKALTVEESVEGANSVSFEAIAATPLTVKTIVSQAPTTVELNLSSENGESRSWKYLVPLNGTYDWYSGILELEDGTQTQLLGHSMLAIGGLSTMTVANCDSIKVYYKTISKGGTAQYEIIHGGNA